MPNHTPRPDLPTRPATCSAARPCAVAASSTQDRGLRPIQLGRRRPGQPAWKNLLDWSKLCALSSLWGVFGLFSLTGLNPAAQAADVSAAAAAALKVLALPLPDGRPSHEASPSPQPTPKGLPPVAGALQAMATTSITVQKGESIDALLQRGLPGLPLSSAFMRQALAQANPRIFPRGTTYPVKPGTVLQLPTHQALGQLLLAQYPQTATLFARPRVSGEADTPAGPDKRHWVRYP